MAEVEPVWGVGPMPADTLIAFKQIEPNALMPEALAMALRIAQGPAVATRLTKTAIDERMFARYTETMEFVSWARAIASASGEVAEGASAFLEKRPPHYFPDDGGIA